MVQWLNGHASLVLTVVLLAHLGAIAVWDVYAAFGPGPQFTVSALFWRWSEGNPVLPFFVGLVAGHLCWQRPPNPFDKVG